MSIKDLQAIDMHAHFGSFYRQEQDLQNKLRSGDVQTVLHRARLANTRLTVVSPLQALMPRGKADPIGGNKHAATVVAQTQGLLQWVVVDPLNMETYDQAETMLAAPKCVGIKVHPEEHCYMITEHGKAIFEFAARHHAIVITHSGEKNSMPEDFVTFADDFPEVTLILAHLGYGWDNDPTHQTRAVKASKHGNIFVDASSATNISSGFLEWAVADIGADRILYGTDSPLYFAPMQRARIDNADISDGDKRLILHDNAASLLGPAAG